MGLTYYFFLKMTKMDNFRGKFDEIRLRLAQLYADISPSNVREKCSA